MFLRGVDLMRSPIQDILYFTPAGSGDSAELWSMPAPHSKFFFWPELIIWMLCLNNKHWKSALHKFVGNLCIYEAQHFIIQFFHNAHIKVN
ncbi:hypothetical protein GDO81_012427 [Engystomops pustulosus]|uniref:Uncharacterized protein n=1 Tax=Engystomops pustulosus TaxID=76066 RepID=A0AAV7BLJ1_ENGPU|nr:hypothetical protein GDO81_012427 [Engystomops pustulosus]